MGLELLRMTRQKLVCTSALLTRGLTDKTQQEHVSLDVHKIHTDKITHDNVCLVVQTGVLLQIIRPLFVSVPALLILLLTFKT